MLADLLFRLRALFRRKSSEHDLDNELRAHIEHQTEKNLRAGFSREEAARRARIQLGGVEQIKEECRQSWGTALLSSIAQDIVYASRTLCKSPGFTATAILSLALGIGANTTIFSTINGIFQGELPFKEASRVVILWNTPVKDPAGRAYGVPAATYLSWKQLAASFQVMGAWQGFRTSLGAAENGGQAERVEGQAFSASMWELAGVQPTLGRVFTADEDAAGNPARVLVVSYDFWQRHFGGESRVLGATIQIDGSAHTIIGVMPKGFQFAERNKDLWKPLGTAPALDGYVVVAARLRNGISVPSAQAEMSAKPQTRGQTIRVATIHDALFYKLEEPLFILQGAVAFVLLIACANVASLLMARAAARRTEVATRVALGASASRVIVQLLTESMLLSFAGAALGIGLAWAGLRMIQAGLPPFSVPEGALSLNGRALAFTTIVAVGTAFLFGLIPALKATGIDVAVSVKQSDRSSTAGVWHHRILGALVSWQFALAVILLAGGGLMGKAFIAVLSNDLGLNPTHLLAFDLNIEQATPAAGLAYQRVHERLRAVPGVESAAAATTSPLTESPLSADFKVLSGPALGGRAAYLATTPDYFVTLKMPLLRGRDFTASDANPVVIVNKALAERWFPNQNPLGRSILIGSSSSEQPREIVGVAGDTLNRRSQLRAEPALFVPHWQQPARSRMVFLMRTTGDPATMIPTVRSALAEVEPNRPADNIRSIEQSLDDQVGQMRVFVVLMIVFGAASALLAGVGIFGVMAYAVSQRTREIGVRMALGATGTNILTLVSESSIRIALSGMLQGLAGAAMLTPILKSYIWTLSPIDPAIYASVSFVLLAIALLACLVPARRASIVDPAITLRSE